MVPGPAQRLPVRPPTRPRVEDTDLFRSAGVRPDGGRPRRGTAEPRKAAMGAPESRSLAPPVRLKPASPSGLAWKLNRLRCMTPAEIGHRVVKAAATRVERWGFVRCEVPAPDLAAYASPWIHAEARVNPSAILQAADCILAGRYDVFALHDIDLGKPPRWNRDPKTGIEAPLDFGKQLD